MKHFIRVILRRNMFVYGICARLYRWFLNTVMRLILNAKGVRYLAPVKPSGRYHSQFGQDYHLDQLNFVPRVGGVIVEVGCNHPINNSNSYFFEQYYGCTCYAIDAIDFRDLYEQYRPKTEFFNVIIDKEEGIRDFYQVLDDEGWENQVSSLHAETLDKGKGFKAKIIQNKSLRLSTLLKNVGKVDVLMVDVEGHEVSVFESMDWGKFKPMVILVENNGEFHPRKLIEEYLTKKGYVFWARIGSVDDIYVFKTASVGWL